MKRGKRCYVVHCFAAAPFASPANPEVHACENHKKRDFVNMRNKRCLAEGCYRNPHYGVSRLVDPNSKAQYCTEHKAPGMQNVNGGRCAGPDCTKQPRFSLPGEKGKFCSKHRGEGMVDVLYTPCAAEGCRKHPHFGYIEGGPRFCAQHRSDGMVDVKHRRCAFKGCRKDRVQIAAGTRKRGKFCEVHGNESDMPQATAPAQPPLEHDPAPNKAAASAAMDKKRDRDWKTEMDEDGEYMSSGGSSVKSTSMGDAGSMPQEHPHGRSTGPAMFYVGDTQTGSQTFPEGESAPKRAGVAMSREEVHARYDGGRHPESFRRHVLASPANGGCSDADIADQGDQRGAARTRYYPDNADSNPYPLFQRDSGPSNKLPESGPATASPEPQEIASAPRGRSRPFRLRYWEPAPNSSDYSWYPCPWEFTKEGQNSRSAEPGRPYGPAGPAYEWGGHPAAP